MRGGGMGGGPRKGGARAGGAAELILCANVREYGRRVRVIEADRRGV